MVELPCRVEAAVLRALTKHVVGEDKDGHGFDHRNRARKHARIVAAPRLKFDFLALPRNRWLRLENRRRGFERHPEKDGFSV